MVKPDNHRIVFQIPGASAVPCNTGNSTFVPFCEAELEAGTEILIAVNVGGCFRLALEAGELKLGAAPKV